MKEMWKKTKRCSIDYGEKDKSTKKSNNYIKIFHIQSETK